MEETLPHRIHFPKDPDMFRPFLMQLAVLILAGVGLAQTGQTKLPVIAITTLESRGVGENEAGVIADNIAATLQQSGKFRVMERSQIDAILKEQSFQQDGVCDANQCAVAIGKLLGIDRIVVGSVGLVGSTYSLNLRIVDVSNGEALRSSSRNHRGSIDDVLTDLVPIAVLDLSREMDAKGAKPVSRTSEPEKSKPIWPWIVGGTTVLVGGGVAAAILLTADKTENTPVSPGENPTPDTDVKFTW